MYSDELDCSRRSQLNTYEDFAKAIKCVIRLKKK